MVLEQLVLLVQPFQQQADQQLRALAPHWLDRVSLLYRVVVELQVPPQQEMLIEYLR